jgi:hypothetical protein
VVVETIVLPCVVDISREGEREREREGRERGERERVNERKKKY